MHLPIDDQFHISDIAPSDKAAYVEYLNEKQIFDQTLAIPNPYTEADADWWIDHNLKLRANLGRSPDWCIRRSEDGKLIGGVGFLGLQPAKNDSAEIGYWLAKPYWNKGIMTAAVRKAVEYGIREFGIRRITAHILPFNIGSGRVLEKNGFIYEGYLRAWRIKRGAKIDAKLYALLAEDFLNPPEKKPRPEFVKNYAEIQEAAGRYPGSDELLSIGSPFARRLGLTRLGLHHEVLPPGRRTSYPHAESEEEEFVFVIEGTPDVWIDGELHRLNPGDGVAFPAGTGIAHSFLNNTDHEVRLFVAGEASKKTNKYFYVFDEDRNQAAKEKGQLWEDPPRHTLGPHDGQTRAVPRKKTQEPN